MLSLNESQNNLTILVVDDDITIRFMIKESLEQIGFQVEEAENGKVGLELAKKLNPDMILLDVMMPEMDGFTACPLIREIPACLHTPILMMTGLDDLESINKSYQVGATDFITKPINYLLLSHRLLYMFRAKQTSDELRASQHRLDHAQRIAKLGYWEWNCNSNEAAWSDQAGEMLGIPDDKSHGDLNYFFQNLPKEDFENIQSTIAFARDRSENYSLEHSVRINDSEERIVYQEAELNLDESGKPSHYIGTIQDITERKRTETKIEKLSHYDKVTALPNRTFLRQKLSRVISRYKGYERYIALLTLDLDHFKRLNDTLGHNVGDKILREVANRLDQVIQNYEMSKATETLSCRHSAVELTLAHFGGDEFVIMIDGINDVQDAAVLSRKLIESIDLPMEVNNNAVTVSASIGISTYPEDGNDVDTLLKQSSAALFHAKGEGRNCYKFYTSSMNAMAFEKLSLEMNLRKAIELQQFQLYYQPKVITETGFVMGMEALLRWQHPELGIVSPVEFIPIAEESGMIIQITEWVFRETCRHINFTKERGLPIFPVSVNLSGADFTQGDLASKLKNIAREMNVDPSLIELEITESLLMSNVERAIATLEELVEHGFSIAIDDFGTGYSSLAYLKRFPISTLKIDRSFIMDINHDHADAAIVQAVIALAHSLKLKVVAEGVEQKEQLHILRENNCDIIQGYYYSQPLKANELLDWVEEQTNRIMEETTELQH